MLLAAKLVQYMHRHMSLNIQGCALAFVFCFLVNKTNLLHVSFLTQSKNAGHPRFNC